MSLLDSICDWSATLPDWHGDAVRRLLLQEDFTEEDRDELIAILKSKYNLPVDKEILPIPLKKGDISGAPETVASIILKSISGLENINKIQDGSELPFSDTGLTVLYGENGTGKSGYARVLKRACRARDTSERILPNVFVAGHTAPAKATFNISVDGQDQSVVWTDGQQSDGILTNICVFDAKCARVIVDHRNEIFYLPYGAHVFSGLARVLGEIKAILQGECPSFQRLEYTDISASTKAAKFITGLSRETTDEQINEFTGWETENEEALKQLSASITKAEADDPIQQAKRIRTAKGTISAFREQLVNLHKLVSDEDSIRESVTRFISATEAHRLVQVEDFSNEPLSGICTDAWKALYEAAKNYSVNVVYKDEEFPTVGEGKVCVWCMQELDADAKTRLIRFKNHMENATLTELNAAQTAVRQLLDKYTGPTFKAIKIHADALGEIGTINPDLHEILIEQTLPILRKRAAEFKKMLKYAKLNEIPETAEVPTAGIEAVETALETEAQKLVKAANPEELEKMKSQLAELQARKLLSQRKDAIIQHRDKMILRNQYLSCINETETGQITRRGRELVSEGFTPALKTALSTELDFFGAGHIPINLRQSGERGTTQMQIQLDGCRDNSIALTQILSEGEQKALAIGGFLAELNAGNHPNPIVFDDPVCSLDHRYREKVAERLATEATKRQVIIFTHDIAFLMQLGFKAETYETPFTAMTIQRRGEHVGHCITDLPWHALPVKRRLGHLRERLNQIKGLHETDLDEYNQQASIVYSLLRETWEAFIEEILLNSTVTRHCQEIQTQRLKSVTITDDDYIMLEAGMGKCSTWMLGHDKSKALDSNRPNPDEVLGDINNLDEFRKTTINRYNDVRKNRG